jgi:hypothetical protein
MKFEHYESGSLYGIRYIFREGERLWPHAHVMESADQAHNIIVLRGSIRFESSLGVELLAAPAVLDFDNSLMHSITALEPDTVIMNMMLNGRPASFAGYTDDQKRGEA